MDKQQANETCRLKILEILDKNFGILAQDETIEELDRLYPKDLPEKLIAEFKSYLQSILNMMTVNNVNIDTLLNAHGFSLASAQKYKDEYELYYDKAHEITLFEKLTNTNENDVIKYKYALYKYTEVVLYSMKQDFIYDVE